MDKTTMGRGRPQAWVWMFALVLAGLIASSLTTCTKSKSDFCCTDASKGCTSIELCGEGLVCDHDGLLGVPNVCVEPNSCDENLDCPVFLGHCNAGTCSPCSTDVQCGSRPTTPVCDRTSGECVACASGEQCPSKLCLPDNTCANEADITYVSNTGSGTSCSFVEPCNMQIFDGLSDVVLKPQVLFLEGNYSTGSYTKFAGHWSGEVKGGKPVAKISLETAIPLGPITHIQDLIIEPFVRKSGTVAIECNGNSSTSVTVQRVQVRSNHQGSGFSPAINFKACHGLVLDSQLVGVGEGTNSLGIAAQSNLTVERTTIAGFTQAGIALFNETSLPALVRIQNVLLVHNGSIGNQFAALQLQATSDASDIGFVTVSKNISATGKVSGVRCVATNTKGLAARGTIHDSIVIDNSGTEFELGACTGRRLLQSSAGSVRVGEQPVIGAAEFVNPGISSQFDFHLQSGSAAIDKGEDGPIVDADAFLRSPMPDLGAYEAR